MADGVDTGAPYPLPRVTIKFCTQCKWMLRAAYYAQELLSTFSTSLGEVALQPSTGGTFTVEIFHPSSSSPPPQPESASAPGRFTPARTVLWDRKTDGGFPETKELKRRVRDVIEPGRDLGHVDRNHARPAAAAAGAAAGEAKAGTGEKTQAQQDKPSRAELEAAGPAGAGYPGASEAAAAQLAEGGAQGGGEKEAGASCGNKRDCEDCD